MPLSVSAEGLALPDLSSNQTPPKPCLHGGGGRGPVSAPAPPVAWLRLLPHTHTHTPASAQKPPPPWQG